MKYTFVITALLLLLVANVLMVTRRSYSYGMSQEPFQNNTMNIATEKPVNKESMDEMMGGEEMNVKEGFASYFLENAAGSNKTYKAIGAYDGVQLPTGNNVSTWRYTAPNEKLLGDEFVPGPDSLFMFKNNQCKPECCGASFSCGGGCVCTTPQQRQYLAGRAGNRTAPEDSA